jgi:hypothetical protein
MKKIFLGLMALSMFAVSCKNETKPADAAATVTEPAKKLTPAEEQKAWMDYATPGDMHKWLAKMDGTWESDITEFMPDGKTNMSKGAATFKMILGGRYQEGVHSGTMMDMPFEGRSITGYDNAKKVWVSSWIDNMGTGLMTMEGTYDDKTKTATYKGKMVDPTSSTKECDYKEVIKFVDDNNQHIEMFTTKDGKEVKMMEMNAKRKR